MLQPALERLGYYISPPGGAPDPFRIPAGQVMVEWMTGGHVRDPESGDLIGAGAVFWHREGQETVHRTEADHHYECMTASFRPTGGPPEWPRRIEWPETDASVAFARDMVYSHHYSQVGLEVLGPLIWARLRFLVERSRREHPEQGVPPRIAACLSHIERAYAEPFRMRDLAARVDLSISHLHSRFREVTGLTPYQYLIRQRMRAARHRLVTTTDPVKAIAVEVGYANTENFCRAFKKETGMTAAAFRRRYMVFPQ